MDLTNLENDQVVKIDYIFLLRRLIDAEDNKDLMLQQGITSLICSVQEYMEEHKCLPYGPPIKISTAKSMFSSYIYSCPIMK